MLPFRILVASPEGETARLVAHVAAEAGCSVMAAGSLAAATRLIAREAPDLLVVDGDLFRADLVESASESAHILAFPRLLLVADADTWLPPDLRQAAAVLRKPLDEAGLRDHLRHRMARTLLPLPP